MNETYEKTRWAGRLEGYYYGNFDGVLGFWLFEFNKYTPIITVEQFLDLLKEEDPDYKAMAEYWQKRCEAAEAVLREQPPYMPVKWNDSFEKFRADWQQLKANNPFKSEQ